MTPPHNIEAEQAILGSVLVNNDLLVRIHDLEPSHFYDPVHADIFKAAKGLIEDGRLASPVTLKDHLHDHPGLAEFGGPPYLARLAGAATSLASVRDYALTVMDMSARRIVVSTCEDATALARDVAGSPVGKVKEFVEERLTQAHMASGAKPPVVSGLSAITSAVEQANEAYKTGESGLMTGIEAIDKKLGGLKPGRLYVIGGRPGMGKTTVALAMAKRVRVPTIFASLEMPEAEIGSRLISQHLRETGDPVAYNKIENGWMNEDEFRRMVMAAKDFEPDSALLKVVEPDNRSLPRLLAAIRYGAKSFRAETPLKLIVIDYLQLIQFKANSANEKIGEILSAIKATAMQLKVPIILLSQLSRGPELREDKRPLPSDFRDSGTIEQDADVLIGCYRDEYYLSRATAKTPEEQADLESERAAAKDKLELILLKFRQGANDTITLHCEVKHNYLADVTTQGEIEF